MAEGRSRPAWAEIDLDAVSRNVLAFRRLVAPSTVCAVVKADGYGHGAVPVAKAALAGGAVGLAVAIVDEGVELKDAGVTAPILLLSEPPADAAETVAAAGLTPTLYTEEGVALMAKAARRVGVRLSVHLKVDTGMHRVGAEPAMLPALAERVAAEQVLRLEGLWTHLPVADGERPGDDAFTGEQLDCLEQVRATLAQAGHQPTMTHAANTAAAIRTPRSRYDLIRCGIGLFGALPSPAVGEHLRTAGTPLPLEPVLSLKARVSALRRLPAGARPSYGRRRPLPADSVVATVPIGYADGVPRLLFDREFEVLIGGRRRPLAGTVTMDQIVVDCGLDSSVAVGDEVVLLGRQGDEMVDAAEWAERLGTITYEVLCGIGPRVPRLTAGVHAAGWRKWPGPHAPEEGGLGRPPGR